MKINTLKNKMVAIFIIIMLIVIGLVIRNNWVQDTEIDIIVITKCASNNSEFWEAAYSGMKDAVEEFKINCTFLSPQFEHEINKQKELILQAIERKPDIIVLAASEYYEIAPYAKKIIDNHIRLVLMDSNVELTSKEKVPFIGTNSFKAGESLGKEALKNTPGKERDSIIIAHYNGVQTSDDRKMGIMKGYGEDRIIETFSCNSDVSVAYKTTMELLKDNDKIANIFATNEMVTIGTALAVEELGLQDKVSVYGFDGSKQHVKFLEKGVIDYTVIQSPYQMGYITIKESIEIMKNKEIPSTIETDFLLISMDNMYEVGYREILFPFVTKD